MARDARRAGSVPTITTMLGRAGVTAALVAVGILVAASPAGAQGGPDAAPDVVPIVECSYRDPGTGLYNTVWGYQNVTPGPKQDTTVPIGPTNRFDSPGEAAGQPVAFKPGRAQNVFVVTHSGSSTWTLTSRAATAPGRPCSSNPVPVAASGLAGIVTLVAVTLVLGAILWWRVRRAGRV